MKCHLACLAVVSALLTTSAAAADDQTASQPGRFQIVFRPTCPRKYISSRSRYRNGARMGSSEAH